MKLRYFSIVFYSIIGAISHHHKEIFSKNRTNFYKKCAQFSGFYWLFRSYLFIRKKISRQKIKSNLFFLKKSKSTTYFCNTIVSFHKIKGNRTHKININDFSLIFFFDLTSFSRQNKIYQTLYINNMYPSKYLYTKISLIKIIFLLPHILLLYEQYLLETLSNSFH